MKLQHVCVATVLATVAIGSNTLGAASVAAVPMPTAGLLYSGNPPSNDECVDANSIDDASAVAQTVIANNAGATSYGELSSCNNGSAGIWFAYTASGTRPQLLIDTCGTYVDSGVDTIVTVFDACEGYEIACDDDCTAYGDDPEAASCHGDDQTGFGETLDSCICMDVTAGTYYILVESFFGDMGDITLTAVEHDDCGVSPDPSGACCSASGTCDLVTQSACETAGGNYLGDGTSCADADCTVGVCCRPADCTYPPHSCAGHPCCSESMTESACPEGGAFFGGGTTCDTVDWPSDGACCYPDERDCYDDRIEASCGGFWFEGTACSEVACYHPGNDTCTRARALEGNRVASTVMARDDSDLAFCDVLPPGNAVWYVVVGTGNELTVTTCDATTDFDTQIQVLCGQCDGLVCVGGNDNQVGEQDPSCDTMGDGVNRGSTVTWCSEVGAEYYIVVGGADGDSGTASVSVADSGLPCAAPVSCTIAKCCYLTADGQARSAMTNEETCDNLGGLWYDGPGSVDCLRGACCVEGSSCVTISPVDCDGEFMGGGTTCDPDPCPTAPINDSCNPAVSISCGSTVVVDNTGANDGGTLSIPGCASEGTLDWLNTVWYKFVPDTQHATIETCATGDSAFDTTIAVYEGECGSQVEVACDDDGCTFPATSPYHAHMSLGNLTPLGDYYIVVGTNPTWAGAAPGEITLSVMCDESPTLVTCCDSDLPGGCGEVTSWECEAGGGMIMDGMTCAESPCAPSACCHHGNCDDLTPQACQAVGGIFVEETTCPADPCATGACCDETGTCSEVAGAAGCSGIYYGNGSRCADVTCPGSAPTNDTCSHAVDVTLGAGAEGNNLGATDAPTLPICDSAPPEGPVWYRVQGNNSTLMATTCQPGTNFDTVLHVYCADCDHLTCVAGNDDQPGEFDPTCDTLGDGVNRGSTVMWCSRSEHYYYVAVGGYHGDAGDLALQVTSVGGACEPLVSCDLPTGACCHESSCSVTEEANCGGHYLGDGTSCDGIDCAVGACCDYDGLGNCDERSSISCTGTFMGDGTECDPDPCLTPPPANDDCAAAITVTEGSSYVFNTSGATTDGLAHPGCMQAGYDDINADVWYVFTAANSGALQVHTCGSDFDTKIAIYDATDCASLGDPIACNDDAVTGNCIGSVHSDLQPEVQRNHTYYIRVGGYGGEAGQGILHVGFNEYEGLGACCRAGVCEQSSAGICWGGTPPGTYLGDGTVCYPDPCLPYDDPPDNDYCSGAEIVDLASGGAIISLDNMFATASTSEPEFDCALPEKSEGGNTDRPGYGSMWYAFTAPSDTVRASTCDSPHDTLLAVYEGTCGNLNQLACSDDQCGLRSAVGVAVTTGETYYVQVASFTRESAGAITLEILSPAPDAPSNDNCADATIVGVGPTTLAETDGALGDVTPPCIVDTPYHAVWYMVAGTGEMMQATTCHTETNFDTMIQVFSSSCERLACLAGNDDQEGAFDPACDVLGIGENRGSTVSWCTNNAELYHIAVGGYGTEVGDLGLSVSEVTNLDGACCTDLDCDDDNVCTWEQCRHQECFKMARMFGDVCGATFTAEPNGTVNLTDVLCTLNAFGLGNLANCPNADVAVASPANCPYDNDVVNLTDILKVLDAFGAPASPAAMFYCDCPQNP